MHLSTKPNADWLARCYEQMPLGLHQKEKNDILSWVFLVRFYNIKKEFWLLNTPMTLQKIISTLKSQKDLMRDYSIKSISLFGSVARNEATDESDVDLLVEFNQDAKVSLFQFSRLRRELRKILQCNVDLVTPDALHKELKADILKEAIHAA